MAIPLPLLDTGRFAELNDDARAAIPRWAPVWTDHNLSDPGITLTELVAAEVDRLMYRVNRITERDRLTLLRLIGFAPRPPTAARGFVAFAARVAVPVTRVIPPGVLLVSRAATGQDTPLVLREEVRVGPSELVTVVCGNDRADDVTIDVSRPLAASSPVAVFGDDPSADAGSALFLGLRPAPEVGEALHIAFSVADSIASEVPASEPSGFELVWEWFDGSTWQPLDADDGTAGLTRTGRVVLAVASAIPEVVYPPATTAAAWLRCRLSGGRPDAAPQVTGIALHAGAVEQAHPALRPRLAPELPMPAEPTDVVALGWGLRRPHQEFRLPDPPVVAGSVEAWVVRPQAIAPEAERVRLVRNLDEAGPHATVAELDPAAGTLTFGDGRRGRVVGPDEFVVARLSTTLAAAGNLRAATACSIDGDPNSPNAALLGAAPGLVDVDLSIVLPWAMTGGADAEPAEHAAGRAARRLAVHERLIDLTDAAVPATLDGLDPVAVADCDVPERALSALDLERIVLATPGRRVARCRVFPELDAALPGMRAAGTASVVVIPSLPHDRPTPTPELLAAVRAEVDRRRIVGSRIVVTAPTYVEVGVRADVVVAVGSEPGVVLAAVGRALDRFLHPLVGGQSGRGWPFGRDVYRADVLAVIDAVTGVSDVDSLEIIDASGNATCGNLCVPSTSLVASGSHDLRSVGT